MVSHRITNNEFNPFTGALGNCHSYEGFSGSLDHNFNSSYSIFMILGFLELERYREEEENEFDHDSQDTVHVFFGFVYLLYYKPALECSDGAKKPKMPKRILLQRFRLSCTRIFDSLLCTLENITNLSKSP